MRTLERFKSVAVFLAAAVFFVFPSKAHSDPPIELPRATVRITLDVPQKYRTGPFKKRHYLFAPPGVKVSVFAAGLKGPRFMATDAKGNIFVSLPIEGKVVVLIDSNGDGVADKTVEFASNLDKPHGLAFTKDGLIVAETGRLVLLKDTNGDLKADSREVITDNIPPGGVHWTRTVVVGPDGGLYVSIGSNCNVCVESDKRRAAIMRFSDSKAEIYARGLRNSVGMAFNPLTGELWAVDNGRDLLGDDLPPEELNKIIEGGDYGWPYCYGDSVADPDMGSEFKCKETIPPVEKIQAHSAPLGIAFGTGLRLKKDFQDALFVAYHGSWNRSVPTGYKLAAIPFSEGRPSGGASDFVTGWLQENGRAWGRPVDPIVGKDGALYLSDDFAGAVYRISAAGNKAVKKKAGN